MLMAFIQVLCQAVWVYKDLWKRGQVCSRHYSKLLLGRHRNVVIMSAGFGK